MKGPVTYFIVFLVGFILGISIYPKHQTPPSDWEEISLVVDTIFIRDTLWQNPPAPIEVLPPDRPAETDTSRVVDDYYSPHIFQDYFQIKDFLDISITDTIGQNLLLGRSIGYNLKAPQFTRTVLKQPSYTFSAHIDTRLNPSLQFGFKRGYVGVGYDFRYNEPYVSFGYKIWEK